VGDCVGDFLFTITGRLNGRLDVTNLFKSETILIVVIYRTNELIRFSGGGDTNEIVFQFTDFKNEDSEFISDI